MAGSDWNVGRNRRRKTVKPYAVAMEGGRPAEKCGKRSDAVGLVASANRRAQPPTGGQLPFREEPLKLHYSSAGLDPSLSLGT